MSTLAAEMLKGTNVALAKRIEHHQKIIHDGTRTEMSDQGSYTVKTPEAVQSERRLRPLLELRHQFETMKPEELLPPEPEAVQTA